MKSLLFRACLPLLPLFLATAGAQEPAAPLEKVATFQDRAAKFNEVLTVPTFETTPAEVKQSVANTLATANAALDKIGKQDLGDVAFATTVGALDDAVYPVSLLGERLGLIQQTSPDEALRDAAEAGIKTVADWSVAIDYREDVYKAIDAYAKTEPKLAGEEARLLADTTRDYRRAGLALADADRKEVEAMRKELTSLATDFGANVTKATAHVTFTRAELAGVPEDFLDSSKVKTGDDEYTIAADETYQYELVEDNAKSEATRHKVYVARDSRAKEANVPIFNKMLSLRNRIALKLGYKSWADFQTEVKMAKTGEAAEKFIDDLIGQTQPKFAAEVDEMRKLKLPDFMQQHHLKGFAPSVSVNTWDARYYTNQIMKSRYQVDTEALRVYFPYKNVLDGMFRIYEHDFGLKFTQVEAPYKWVPDLQLFVASDAQSGEPLGLFYLDMFPRKGKYGHFEEVGIIDGKLLDDGKYQRPAVCLVCNFPPPADGKPSLLTHDDVTTVFHEFGHALHAMLTRARFGRYAGTNVPGDFVEAPSQMLENWPLDKNVLDQFAADYRDSSKKIPTEILNQLKAAQLATAGTYYHRQFAFAKLDLVLHGPHPADAPYDCVGVSNDILAKVYLPIDSQTAMIASFGHLADGYDAGYYGYAWARAIAADMATVFRQAPGGFMDADVGRKLRTEIYQPGNSRDVGESVEKFLGRPRSTGPFLANDLGLQPGNTKDADAPPVPASVK